MAALGFDCLRTLCGQKMRRGQRALACGYDDVVLQQEINWQRFIEVEAFQVATLLDEKKKPLTIQGVQYPRYVHVHMDVTSHIKCTFNLNKMSNIHS